MNLKQLDEDAAYRMDRIPTHRFEKYPAISWSPRIEHWRPWGYIIGQSVYCTLAHREYTALILGYKIPYRGEVIVRDEGFGYRFIGGWSVVMSDMDTFEECVERFQQDCEDYYYGRFDNV